MKSRHLKGLILSLVLCILLVVVAVNVEGRKKQKRKNKNSAGKIRRFYIAAEGILWDYAPSGYNLFDGATAPLEADMINSPTRIGRKYYKAVFREYTDATFKHKKKHPNHLGVLGPVMHAEVGDQIRVLFKNNLDFAASMHPHGVHYKKNGEGASYYDNTEKFSNKGDSVMPMMTHEYVWDVPERAGPMKNGPSSIGWLYHSHAMMEGMETSAGLMGMFVIVKKGMLDEKKQKPCDVDREYFALPRIIDETQSPLYDENIRVFLNASGTLSMADADKLKKDAAFATSNQKHSINGYMFNNLPGYEAIEGEKIRWYVASLGNVDLHPLHWHGNDGIEDGIRRVDSILVSPGVNRVLDMECDNPGTWLFHCHIDNHMMTGMSSVYIVKKRDE
ncbi:hypothetical protein ABK040_009245 [Willaertia magna]